MYLSLNFFFQKIHQTQVDKTTDQNPELITTVQELRCGMYNSQKSNKLQKMKIVVPSCHNPLTQAEVMMVH